MSCPRKLPGLSVPTPGYYGTAISWAHLATPVKLCVWVSSLFQALNIISAPSAQLALALGCNPASGISGSQSNLADSATFIFLGTPHSMANIVSLQTWVRQSHRNWTIQWPSRENILVTLQHRPRSSLCCLPMSYLETTRCLVPVRMPMCPQDPGCPECSEK